MSRRACSGSSTRSPTRQPGCATPATTCSPPTAWPAPCTPRCSPIPPARRTTPDSSTSTRASRGLLHRLGPGRRRHRCHAALGSRPQPLRQETSSSSIGELSTRSENFRARWAAHNVRFHRDRAQETPPPGRRRSRPQLRGHGTAIPARASPCSSTPHRRTARPPTASHFWPAGQLPLNNRVSLATARSLASRAEQHGVGGHGIGT